MGYLRSVNRGVDIVSNKRADEILVALIGKGIKFPITFSENLGGVDGVASSSSIDLINRAIYFVLTCRKGEYFMHPAFGSDLPYMLFEHWNGSLAGRMEREVRDSIGVWVPQIALGDINIYQDELDDTLIHVTGNYTIRNTPFSGSFVYPFQIGTGNLM